MKRSKSKRSKEAMTLFPFLAVLVCTMGILIVLLVIVTKLADDRARQASQAAEDEIQREIEAAELQHETEQLRVDGISKMRPGLQDKLENQRSIRSHVENDIRKLREKAEKLKVDFELLLQKRDDVKLASYEEEVGSLKKQLEQSRQKANQLKHQTFSQPVVYSLVPHSGKGEANRRPIYVECTRDGITLQPYGIVLRQEDFTRPIIPGNPFDSALLAVREYWIQKKLVDEETRPYPLMVVRPGGEISYGMARRALKTWEDQFGYELVEAKKILNFGEQDTQLKDKIAQAIRDAKKFQSQIALTMEREKQRAKQLVQGGGPRRGMRASPTGGFVADSPGPEYSRTGNRYSSSTSTSGSNRSGSNRISSNRTGTNQTGENGVGSTNSIASGNSSTSTGQLQSNSNQFSGGSQATGATQPGQSKLNQKTVGNQTDQSTAANATTSSLANQRGKGWALPTRTQGGTAYKRPIKLICNGKEIIIRPNASIDRAGIRIPVTSNYTKTVDHLVQKVWDVIESWDLAAARGYWKPELVFEIQNGGQQHYQKIKMLLEGSGLDIKGTGK